MIDTSTPPDLFVIKKDSELFGDPPSPSEKRWLAEGKYLEPYFGGDNPNRLVSKVMPFLSVVRPVAFGGGWCVIIIFLALDINWLPPPFPAFRCNFVAFDFVGNMHVHFILTVAELLKREKGSLKSFWGSIAIAIEINYIDHWSRGSTICSTGSFHVDYSDLVGRRGDRKLQQIAGGGSSGRS